MPELKRIETNVLLVMLAAHCSDYGRELTRGESIDCDITIKRLRAEIASRKKEEGSKIPQISPGVQHSRKKRRPGV